MVEPFEAIFLIVNIHWVLTFIHNISLKKCQNLGDYPVYSLKIYVREIFMFYIWDVMISVTLILFWSLCNRLISGIRIYIDSLYHYTLNSMKLL